MCSLVQSIIVLSINSTEDGLYFNATKFPLSASLSVFVCTQTSTFSFGGNGTKFNFISVIKTRVPSDPAINLLKLNFSLFSEKISVSNKRSIAYPVFLLLIDLSGNSFLIFFWFSLSERILKIFL